MKRCVIVGGADINNYDYVRSRLCADDYIVFLRQQPEAFGCIASKTRSYRGGF